MKRENSIDCLRVLACILVVLIHVTSIYINRYFVEDGIYFLIGNLYDSFSRVAVPIFVILSGRYAIEDSRNLKKISYYFKIFKKIYIPTLIWSFIYLISSYFFIYNRDWSIPIRALLEGVPFYHMWYPYMCIVLYLLTPYLIKIRIRYGDRFLLKIGISFLFLGIFLSFLQEYLLKIDFYNRDDYLRYLKYIWYYNYFKFILYLGYFILGYSLKNIKISKLKGILGYFSMSLILFLLVQNSGDLVFYNYNFVTTVIGSFLLYLTFNSLDIEYDFSKLSKNTFNIYLIHAGIIEVFQIIMGERIYSKNPLYSIPIITILVFIFSLFISDIIKKFIKFIGGKNG